MILRPGMIWYGLVQHDSLTSGDQPLPWEQMSRPAGQRTGTGEDVLMNVWDTVTAGRDRKAERPGQKKLKPQLTSNYPGNSCHDKQSGPEMPVTYITTCPGNPGLLCPATAGRGKNLLQFPALPQDRPSPDPGLSDGRTDGQKINHPKKRTAKKSTFTKKRNQPLARGHSQKD